MTRLAAHSQKEGTESAELNGHTCVPKTDVCMEIYASSPFDLRPLSPETGFAERRDGSDHAPGTSFSMGVIIFEIIMDIFQMMVS